MPNQAVLFPLPDMVLKPFVQQALLEDLGRRGDITSATVIPIKQSAQFAIVSRQHGVLAGMDLARLAFHEIDAQIHFQALVNDGTPIHAGQILAHVDRKSVV